jgi:hypothetical protein
MTTWPAAVVQLSASAAIYCSQHLVYVILGATVKFVFVPRTEGFGVCVIM